MSSEDNPVELLSVVQFSSDSDTVTYLSRPDNGAGEAIQHSQPDGPSEDSEDKDRQLTSKSKLYHKVKEFVGCGDPSGGGSAELKKELTVLSGVAFITGNIIGSGIYIAPRKIFENTGSFGLTMVVWLIGAIIALVGGLCYIELAAVVRKSGGEYSILLTAYSFNERNVIVKTLGRVIAFLYAWSTVVVVRSISCSIILLTCARYFSRPFYIDCEVPRSVVTTLALALLCESSTHHTCTHIPTHTPTHMHTHTHTHTNTHAHTYPHTHTNTHTHTHTSTHTHTHQHTHAYPHIHTQCL